MKRHLIIAGIPRCGTTMVARAAAGLEPSNKWPSRQEPVNGIIKRHLRLSHQDITHADAAIFLHGDIAKAIISTKRSRMDWKHLMNCRCQKPLDQVDIFTRDDLHYEEMFDFWTSGGLPIPVLAVRFERIWEKEKELRNFLQGFTGWKSFKLPPKQRRVTKLAAIKPQDLDRICKTYASLILKTGKMPDIKRIPPYFIQDSP